MRGVEGESGAERGTDDKPRVSIVPDEFSVHEVVLDVEFSEYKVLSGSFGWEGNVL